jgi:hypothetical protein
VKAELDEEWRRKTSLDQRGQALLTTSASISSIALGVVSLGAHELGIGLKASTLTGVGIGLFFLFAAVAMGIRTSSLLKYDGVKTSDLSRLLNREFWDAGESIATLRATEVRIAILTTARELNEYKSQFLSWGQWFQLIGLIALGAAVVSFLLTGPQS